jgi:transcriptional regulator with XRE-family HTH domain
VNVELTDAAVQEFRRLVEASGLSREELARRAEVSSRAVYYLLRGNASVRVVTLVALLKAVTDSPATFLQTYCGIDRRDKTTVMTLADRDPKCVYATGVAHGPSPTVAEAVAFLARQFALTPAEVMEAIAALASRRHTGGQSK